MYKEYLEVSKNFKSSVNLEFDLNNEDKILEYIPTKDLCDVLKIYIKSIIEPDKLRSTILSGPYGKGKSYLMLMLTYLIGKRENKELLKKILKKIKLIDLELFELVKNLEDKQISLLPVIINNNTADDLNQRFMIALNTALNENDLSSLVPNSNFEEAISVIKEWKKEEKLGNFKLFESCLQKLSIDIDKLVNGLKKYDNDAFKSFKELFKCVSYGANFNPLINNDIAYIYNDVAIKLKKYGYSGIFVIYDEFGVFLENQSIDFEQRLNKIQNFAEKCNSSEQNELHLCLVTHKDFVLYSKSKSLNDTFQKISGRFKNVRFDRSLEENYEIIAQAIIKKPGYKKLVTKFKEERKEFIKNLSELEIFSEKELDFLVENGLPFNPLSIYFLVRVSEKIAQNERTMFTFLTDKEQMAFNYFIDNYDSLLNVDYLYEYFSPLIKDDEVFFEMYRKVSSLLNILDNELEKKLVKAVALFKIVNDEIKLPIRLGTLSLALDVEEEKLKNIIDTLIKNNFLKFDSVSGNLDFSILVDNNINAMLNQIIDSKLINYKLVDLLNEFEKDTFFVSNKYNFEYKMTRFMYQYYIDYESFMSLNDIRNIEKYNKADGIILNVLMVNNKDDLLNKLLSFKRPNIIVRNIKKRITKVEVKKFKTLKACKIALESKNLGVLERENLSLYYEELKGELSRYLDFIRLKSDFISVTDKEKLPDIIYDVFKTTYSETIIFNNEQINKNNLSSISTKARNNVGDIILKIMENDFRKTSLEMTIYDSFLESINNCEEIINLIKNIVLSGNDIKLINISKILEDSPFGIRKGVIPLLVAYVLSLLSGMDNAVLLYNNQQEIDLCTANLSSGLNDEKYSLRCMNFAKESYELVLRMLNSLTLKTQNNIQLDIKSIVLKLRENVYCYNPIIIRSNKKDNILNLSEIELSYLQELMKNDLNTFDLLLKKLPKILECKLENLDSNIIKVDKAIKSKEGLYYKKLNNEVRNIFESDISIKTGFEMLVNDRKIVFPSLYKELYNILLKTNHDDYVTLDLLSIKINKCHLRDNNVKKDENLKKELVNFVNYIKNYVEKEEVKEEKIELSPMGETLLTNLEDMLSEYGTSISNKEKEIILKSIITKLGSDIE